MSESFFNKFKCILLAYKFIYFDLDDTLLDHKRAEVSGLQDVHQHFSLFEGIDQQQLIDIYHEVNSEQWGLYSRGEVKRDELQRNRFEMTLDKLGLDKDRHEEVGSRYMEFYRKHWQWIEGARDAYHKVLERYPVGILTNGFAETQRLKFEKFDLYDTAEHVVISEDVGVLKPDPKVFQHATELSGVKAEDILYVGDSFSSDIEGGSRFGWNTAWFTTSEDNEQHKKADFVFNDFNDLTAYLNH